MQAPRPIYPAFHASPAKERGTERPLGFSVRKLTWLSRKDGSCKWENSDKNNDTLVTGAHVYKGVIQIDHVEIGTNRPGVEIQTKV